LARCRWNVLDLMQLIGGKSIPTYLFCDIDMTWAEGFRKDLAARGQKTTITAILIKAMAIAQHNHPASRSVIMPFGRQAILNKIVAGITIERFVDGQPAVFFGSIHEPDTKSVVKIAQELKDYGQKDIKDLPQLDIEDRFSRMPWLLRQLVWWIGMQHPYIRLRFMGATFGLSTLGKFQLQAIIPPCVTTSTFGIGRVEERAVVRNGHVEIRPMGTLTLNFDHRLIDGGPAARFIEEVRLLMEGGLADYINQEVGSFAPTETSVDTSMVPAGIS